VASLVAIVAVFSRVLPGLRDVHGSYLQVIHMLPAFQSTLNLLEECQGHRDVTKEGNASELAFRREIALRNVSFRYQSDSEDWTLRDVDLQIPVGRTTAIVGSSGAGKSTVADLLLTLVQPTEGQMLLDGRPLSEQQVSSWRRMIGYVPQETYLSHDFPFFWSSLNFLPALSRLRTRW